MNWQDPRELRRQHLEALLHRLQRQEAVDREDVALLSDLTPEEARPWRDAWPRLPVETRRQVCAWMCELLDADARHSFFEIGRIAVEDEDPQVRAAALRLLAVEDTEARTVVTLLIRHLWDEDEGVRAQAAEGLALYVLMGMVDRLPRKLFRRAVAALLHVLHEAPPTAPVWPNALKAVSYTDLDHLKDLLEFAYYQGDPRLRAASLIAMGRTLNPEWHRYILADLQHRQPQVRAAAAEAAGFAEIKEALDDLLYLLTDAVREVRMAAAWAVSEISDDEAHLDVLEQAWLQAEDDEERAAMEDALSNLQFRLMRQELNLLDLALKEGLDEPPRLGFRDEDEPRGSNGEHPA